MSRTFDTYDRDFRNGWETTYRITGYGYERFRPAYQYGYHLATEQRFRGRAALSRWNTLRALRVTEPSPDSDPASMPLERDWLLLSGT